MILAIDMGNTNIVVGGIDDSRIYFQERLTTQKASTVLEYSVVLDQLLRFEGYEPGDFEGAALSSVVPQANNALICAVKKVTGLDCMVVDSHSDTGIGYKTDNPEETGGDIIVSCAAVAREYPLPAAIIDMGTATTISILDEDRNFLGCLIHPGIKKSLDTLSGSASLLPHIDLTEGAGIIGTNTADSMRSGVLFGHASIIDGCIMRMEEELGRKLNVVVTGGLASCVIPLCRRKNIIYDDNLLLKGLYYIYKNRS